MDGRFSKLVLCSVSIDVLLLVGSSEDELDKTVLFVVIQARFAADANAKNSYATRFGPRDAVILSLETRRRLTIAVFGKIKISRGVRKIRVIISVNI